MVYEVWVSLGDARLPVVGNSGLGAQGVRPYKTRNFRLLVPSVAGFVHGYFCPSYRASYSFAGDVRGLTGAPALRTLDLPDACVLRSVTVRIKEAVERWP